MKFLLAAVNAKYIHSNLGIYSLKKYAEENLSCSPVPQIELGEYTINHRTDYILQDIYRRDPDIVGFSCYIWNILYVKEIIRDLKKIRPAVRIWLGGPEVSYNAAEILREMPEADCVLMGEGEQTFSRLVEAYEDGNTGDMEIPGVAFRDSKGEIRSNAPAPLMELSKIPFSYGDLSNLEHRIIYYESSRGCPFSCSYCLSSIDKTVRFRDLSLVKQELSFFLERKVPQVKFVDRTFNCKKSHSMGIWQYILEHDNGVTNFHFEISADLLDDEELALMKEMRPGLIQLEIGVQTTNPDTIREIRRSMDLQKLKKSVAHVKDFHNIHQHLDLIAGLPFEDRESFRRSFSDVYVMAPSQLQLGFLKVLKGSYMETMAGSYGLVFKSAPPYEVLATKWLSYDDVLRLKALEEMVEVYYNSGQFGNTVKALEGEFETPYDLFEALGDYYQAQQIEAISHSRLARYEILYEFICRNSGDSVDVEKYRDLLMCDLYLRENLKSRPTFSRDQNPYKEQIKTFFIEEAIHPRYLKGYEAYDSRQISKMAHIEVMRDGSMVLFDYQNRDALYGNASAVVLKERIDGKRD